MRGKPIVLVTRKLPDAVEDRLRRDYEPRLNPDDRLYSGDELVALSNGADAIMPCHTEHFSAEVIARLPDCVRQSPIFRLESTMWTCRRRQRAALSSPIRQMC